MKPLFIILLLFIQTSYSYSQNYCDLKKCLIAISKSNIIDSLYYPIDSINGITKAETTYFNIGYTPGSPDTFFTGFLDYTDFDEQPIRMHTYEFFNMKSNTADRLIDIDSIQLGSSTAFIKIRDIGFYYNYDPHYIISIWLTKIDESWTVDYIEVEKGDFKLLGHKETLYLSDEELLRLRKLHPRLKKSAIYCDD